MNFKAYAGLLIFSLVAAVGGILTLLPASGASYLNVLGYRSLCTFAPAATLFCFGIAGASCVLRASLIKRRAQFGKPVFKAPAIAVVSILLILGIAATGWFVSVKRQYIDGSSGATVALARQPGARQNRHGSLHRGRNHTGPLTGAAAAQVR